MTHMHPRSMTTSKLPAFVASVSKQFDVLKLKGGGRCQGPSIENASGEHIFNVEIIFSLTSKRIQISTHLV